MLTALERRSDVMNAAIARGPEAFLQRLRIEAHGFGVHQFAKRLGLSTEAFLDFAYGNALRREVQALFELQRELHFRIALQPLHER